MELSLSGSARFAKASSFSDTQSVCPHCGQRNVLSTPRRAQHEMSNFERALPLESRHVKARPSSTQGPQFGQHAGPGRWHRLCLAPVGIWSKLVAVVIRRLLNTMGVCNASKGSSAIHHPLNVSEPSFATSALMFQPGGNGNRATAIAWSDKHLQEFQRQGDQSISPKKENVGVIYLFSIWVSVDHQGYHRRLT